MYIAPKFKVENSEAVCDVIRNYSFATLISTDLNGEVFVSHIPVLAEFGADKLISLKGHLSLNNPHVQLLKKNPQATIIFHGPHSYISPTWYRSGRDVPTWNYVVVHVKGKIKFGSSFKELVQLLAQTSQKYEASNANAWKFELPADLKDEASLMNAIIAFEMLPASIEAKFKLSQNRSQADQDGIIDGLSRRVDEMSQRVKELMAKSTS